VKPLVAAQPGEVVVGTWSMKSMSPESRLAVRVASLVIIR
jgi:hypothetical protein